MKIALTYTGSEKKHLNYVNWLKGNNSIEIVELSADKNNLNDLSDCDGLVLSGGVDIHPKYYNSTELNYSGADDFNVERDQFEMDAFNLAQENKLPVLGICRGMQFINCILGGTLNQDLGELNSNHKGSPDKKHFVKISSGSLLYQIAKTENAEVNSAHHQAIDKLGKGLKVNCIAPDKTVEGIERVDEGSFILAVQWHPERMFNFQLEGTSMSKGIREYFIQRIQSR
jgi:putative glutamine amidotransferase